MRIRYLQSGITTALIILFTFTATNKLFRFHQFSKDMMNQPFPDWFNYLLIGLVPATEIIISLLLIFAATRKAGIMGAFILMFLFTGYVALVLLNGLAYIPCSCGGVIESFSWIQHLYFNLFFLLLALIALIVEFKPFGIKNISRDVVAPFRGSEGKSRKPLTE